MDQRVYDHAETLVDWSARIEAGDDVVLRVSEGAHDLAVAVAETLGERGANLLTVYSSDEISRAYLRGHDGDFDEDPEYELAMYERADSVLSLGGGRNTTALADVSSDRRQAAARAREGIREARLDTDWVSTVHPTRSLALAARHDTTTHRQRVWKVLILSPGYDEMRRARMV